MEKNQEVLKNKHQAVTGLAFNLLGEIADKLFVSKVVDQAGSLQKDEDYFDKIYTTEKKISSFKTMYGPTISNAFYQREKEVIENEKWKTIYGMAQVLSPEDFTKVINQLQYNIK